MFELSATKSSTFPEAANGRIKALAQVFRWAIENDLTDTDPTASVDYLSSGSEGFHTWTVEEVRP